MDAKHLVIIHNKQEFLGDNGKQSREKTNQNDLKGSYRFKPIEMTHREAFRILARAIAENTMTQVLGHSIAILGHIPWKQRTAWEDTGSAKAKAKGRAGSTCSRNVPLNIIYAENRLKSTGDLYKREQSILSLNEFYGIRQPHRQPRKSGEECTMGGKKRLYELLWRFVWGTTSDRTKYIKML